MDSSIHQQIISLIEHSNRILLCTHRKPDGDAVGSIMAITKALNLLGKEVTAACADQLPESFDFLPGINQLHQEVPGGRDFVVTLDCDKTEIDRLKYHLEDNKIHIVITPKQGRLLEQNVSCQERAKSFDLIMTVDVADIPQLGKLYENNVDLFTSLPILNIDHHISNTEFGKVNYVDVAASSTSEILYGLIRDMEKHFGKSLIVPDVATLLLSGVTTDTGSFQNANTTPRSMQIAAELMEAGANQHDVIKYLFRTKKLSTLKLWGKILTKIEVDEKHRLVWSSITQQDLKQSGASIDEAGDIIDDLLVHAPEAEMVALFKEDEDMISVSFRSTTPQANVMEVAHRFGGGGHVQAAGVKFPGKRLSEVMNQVVAALQEAQQKRLGLEGIQHDVEIDASEPVTQVLEGYTPVPDTSSVRPTLEERVQSQTPLGAQEVQEIVPPGPAEASVPQQPGKTDFVQPPVQAAPEPAQKETPAVQAPPGKDIHAQAKAAITAEQSQASDASFTPSQGVKKKERNKPKGKKRFTNELPDFLKPEAKKTPPETSTKASEGSAKKAPPAPQQGTQSDQKAPSQDLTTNTPQAQVPPVQNDTPPSPPPAAPEEDKGVKVSYGNQPAPTTTPAIPPESSEPVVKQIGSTPQGAAGGGNQQQGGDDQGGAGAGNQQQGGGQGGAGTGTQQQGGAQGGTGNQQQGDGSQGAAGTAADPKKPEPPKDPFALGDDGMTDIERALGGL